MCIATIVVAFAVSPFVEKFRNSLALGSALVSVVSVSAGVSVVSVSAGVSVLVAACFGDIGSTCDSAES